MSPLKITTPVAPGPRLGRGGGIAGPSRSLASLHRPAHACVTRALPGTRVRALLGADVCTPQKRGNRCRLT